MNLPLLPRLYKTLFPRRCLTCGRRLAPDELLVCSVCDAHLPRTEHLLTPRDNDMVRMFWGHFTPERAVAYLHHYPHSESGMLIYVIKYGNGKSVAVRLGRMAGMESMRHGFFDGIDIIVPVPLARERQRQRGYNQSLAIARGISEKSGIAVGDDVMVRTVFVRTQTNLHQQERHENVDGVFSVTNAAPISGRHVLIVDDVITTGATMIACGKAAMAAGAARVSFLAIGMSSS